MDDLHIKYKVLDTKEGKSFIFVQIEFEFIFTPKCKLHTFS